MIRDTEHVETVIIGGGHAGLTMSYSLSRLGREHVILERGRVGERWRSERWDSFHFQFFITGQLSCRDTTTSVVTQTPSRRAVRSSDFSMATLTSSMPLCVVELRSHLWSKKTSLRSVCRKLLD